LSALQVFEGLIAGTLPVYKGASSIDRFMPDSTSFLNANTLNPRQLADKLLALSADERAYNAYFEFKQRPLREAFQEMALMSYVHPNVLCRLCDRIPK
jgi:hypothetical protein